MDSEPEVMQLPAGLIGVPQSTAEIQRRIFTKPVSVLTSTTQAFAALVNVIGGGW